ncbi:MAG TPA: TIGR02678 family protein [Streptosporangiaceae bacterium]|jgi:uncharacterized protein (TIGR02678 family)
MTEFEAELAAERRAVARLLLRCPLVTPGSHPEEFALVRRHADWLVRQFHQVLGYRLTVEGRFARLHKPGPGAGAGRRLERTGGGPFTPRAYAYLALALSVLVTAPEQLLLSELVTRTRAAAAEAGVDLGEPNRPAERRALVAALRQLTEWRVLREDEGTVDRFATDDGESEALLGIDREIARRLVSGPLTRVADAGELVAAATDPGPGGTRHAVRRRLVESPVVYLDELTDDQRAWLRREQRAEQRLFEDFLGLDTEIRAEGAAMLDPAGELTDLEFPGTGTVPQAALLLVERLLADLRPTPDGPVPIGVHVSAAAIEGILADLVTAHGTHWARAHVDHPDLLFDAVTGLLIRMKLLARDPSGDTWTLRAAAARYRPDIASAPKEPRT